MLTERYSLVTVEGRAMSLICC